MKEKPLIQTNPYLKNKSLRERLFAITTTSNAAVEGVHIHLPAGSTHSINQPAKKKRP